MSQAFTKVSANTRIADIAAQCVMCGLCLPHCPSYVVTRIESDSPRGRLALMAKIAAGEISNTQHPSLDRCLACGRCERACPPKVRFIEALMLTRTLHGPSHEHWSGRLARWTSQRGNLRKRLPQLAIKIRRWLPPTLRRKLNLDGLAITATSSATESSATKPTDIVVLAGCMANAMEGRAIAAIHDIAQRLALSVRVDRDHCCGALNAHLGRPVAEPDAVKRPAPMLVTINSGCMAQWRQLFGDPRPIGMASWLDSVFTMHGDRLVARPLRIALHLPCTQQAQTEEVAAMHRLVGRLPGATLLALPAQPGCCGAAGSYFLNQTEIAQALAATASTHIQSTGPDIVLSANGACRAQLVQALFDAGSDIRVMHPAELVAEYLDEPAR